MIKNLDIKLYLLIVSLCIVCSCEDSEVIKNGEIQSNTKVETINGLMDPDFMALAEPFTNNSIAGRVVQNSDFQEVKKLTGDGYVNYTVSIKKLDNTPFASHSLIMSMRNDTARYNLLEIIPDKSWNGNFEGFTGKITTYLIEFGEQDGNNSGRVLQKTTVDNCLEFVIDRVVVHADLSATVYGHWEEDDDCVNSGGGGGSSGGGYYWVPNWGSGSSGDWSGGGQTGSGGGGSGSGSGSGNNGGNPPNNEEFPISLEDAIEAQVEQILDDDPFALVEIDCDQLPKWQNLAQHTPSAAIMAKLESLDDEFPIGDVELQSLEDGSGSVVNMDYFPLTVQTLPKNLATGSQFTASEFLNHIRLNINNFINTDLSEFSPSTITGQNEAAIWNSSNPLGAIIHINIGGGAGDGSVVCSSYASSAWIFSTIEVPYDFIMQDWDGEHPVSGNREFGYTQNTDGSYTFYTRGVDRITDPVDAVIAENLMDAFANPDALWTSFKEGVYDFVQKNAGQATAPKATDNKIYRPDWEKVKAVLNGSRPISDLGCK